MPDVSSTAPVLVTTWVAIDQHKLSLVAGILPASGGTLEVVRVENTERAVRRLVDKLGGPEGLAVCYEAGPGGYELHRLLSRLGVACDVIAPSLIPIRAGDRVKTDRRDAKKLVRLYRAGELVFVQPPSPAQEGLRDLVRCRDDLRRARTAARHRIAKPRSTVSSVMLVWVWPDRVSGLGRRALRWGWRSSGTARWCGGAS